MTDRIDPVVVHGHGRTGTTLLVRLLGMHPDLAWFSQYHGRWPGHPAVAGASRLADVESLRRRLGSRRWFPQPAEAIQAWERYFPGFHDNRPGFAEEPRPAEALPAFRRQVEATRRWHGKPGFVTKYTGYPRYELVRAALPGVRIVHVDRDPRAVVMSVVKQRWGFKRDPEGWAGLSATDRIDLAADRYLHWAEAMDRYRPGVDYRPIRYEDLIADPEPCLLSLLDDLGLDRSAGFERRLRATDFQDASESWRKRTTGEEAAHLEHRLGPALEARGYS